MLVRLQYKRCFKFAQGVVKRFFSIENKQAINHITACLLLYPLSVETYLVTASFSVFLTESLSTTT